MGETGKGEEEAIQLGHWAMRMERCGCRPHSPTAQSPKWVFFFLGSSQRHNLTQLRRRKSMNPLEIHEGEGESTAGELGRPPGLALAVDPPLL